jgi:hypothetical protein
MYMRERNTKHGLSGTPYYVGKGYGNRAFSRKHRVHIPSDKNDIVFVAEGLTEEQAHSIEKEQIAKFGRLDLGTGCLTNLTDGGEGQCGVICSDELRLKRHLAMTESRRAKISSFMREQWKRIKESGERKVGFQVGFKHTEESRKKMSASRMGHPSYTLGKKIHSEEHKEALRKKMLGNRNNAGRVMICDPATGRFVREAK